MKDRAAVGIVRRRQLSFVRVDDRAADRQAEAEPAGLRRDERLEHLLELALGDSRPAIGDGDDDVRAIVGARREREPPLAEWRVVHRVAGVENQIEQHLKELDAIASHVGQRRREIRRHRNAAREQLAAHDRERLRREVRHAKRHEQRVGLLDEQSELADDLRGARIVANDVVENLANLIEVGRARPPAGVWPPARC